MDYIGYKCPVCDKYFHVGDDVVVCPECGTPSHRECYENLGRCVNSEKHKDGYDFLESMKEAEFDKNEGITTCPKCGTKNSESAFFCSKCGETFIKNQRVQQNDFTTQNEQEQQGTNASPFAGPNVIMFDPLAGISPNTDIGDGVTAAEAAKFVKQNTPYFITIFNNIKNFSRSRFNFCAMIFGGGYLLFRKMYKLGTVITAIQTAMTIVFLYLEFYIRTDSAFSKLMSSANSYDSNATMLHMADLSSENLLILMLYGLLAFMIFVMGVVIGACANRMYYTHCKKQINKIKAENTDAEKRKQSLEKRGGVNAPLALSLWITYIVITYLPVFFY